MHQFLYDYLDSDEKPSEDSYQPTSSSSTSSHAREGNYFANKNQLRITNKSAIERENRDERTAKPMRFERSCVKFKNHYSQEGDEVNLSKCCQDKLKESEMEKGHFSKSRRRLFQDSTFEQLQKKTDKFLSRGSKRGQCTSSTYFKCRHQDQEYRSNNLENSKLWVPTSLKLRRSTPKPTFSDARERLLSCCSNCSCCSKTAKWENPNISEKFNPLNSERDLRESKCGTCNSCDHFYDEVTEGNGKAVNISSSESLSSGRNDTFSEVDNKLNNVRRVLCLDELNEHVTKALNEMFMKLCPVDIACFNSYNYKTADDKKEHGKRISASRDGENNFNKQDYSTIVEVTNEKENRQSGDSTQDKTTTVEDDNFSQFGAEVTRVLKESNREKALRLKAAIKQTLESAKKEG
ncbi:uncharacterized protein LOC122508185 isoform X1 [Leptopilina heterotoma]|uniref:uncharacterized protein LOC122508185 isoform X1 n=1 Tax=Leptopilina heterotoma TaxID=63436 RepID=UPI001CA89697|nr:uncharacterized protein LOC122508185 isoform X1 [Leptopilina heterotoma]XP_043477281.1 uncharacterized protein LOC122508185 isoform X1 [Leptopilina heterotoma]